MPKLGELISEMGLTREEQVRLSQNIVKKSGLPFEVLVSKTPTISDQDFWHYVHKKLKIRGFRPGRAKDHVLKIVLETRDPLNSSKESHVLWRLYRRCAISYIIENLKNLNKLLLEEDAGELSENDTESLFRAMAAIKDSYDVEEDDLLDFYEIWPFSRISNIKEIIGTSEVSTALVSRMIDKKLKGFRDEFSDLATKEDVEYSVEKLKKEFKNDFLKEKRWAEKKFEDTKLTISSIRTEFQNSIASLASKSNIPNEIKESLTTLKDKLDNQKTAVSTDALNVFQERFEHLEKSFENVIETVNKKSATGTLKHNKGIEVDEKATFQQLISETARGLKESKFQNINSVSVAGLYGLLFSSKAFITESTELIDTIIASLPIEANVFTLVANPLVKDLAELIDAADITTWQESNSKHLIIRDFDIGIQEVYLIPALTKLLADRTRHTFVYLVPSEADLGRVSPRVLEFAPPVENLFKKELKEQAHEIPSISVKTILENNIDIDKTNQTDLATLAKNMGLNLPPRLLETYSKYQALANRLLSRSLSSQLALEITVMSWLEHKKGVPFRRALEERVTPLLEGFS